MSLIAPSTGRLKVFAIHRLPRANKYCVDRLVLQPWVKKISRDYWDTCWVNQKISLPPVQTSQLHVWLKMKMLCHRFNQQYGFNMFQHGGREGVADIIGIRQQAAWIQSSCCQLGSDLLTSVTVHHSDYTQAVQFGDETKLLGAITN